MPIQVTCPGCGQRLKAKDSLAGRRVACPQCGQKLVVGSLEDAAAALLLDQEAAPESPPPAAPPPPASADHLAPADNRSLPAPAPPLQRLKKKNKPTPLDVAALPPLTTNDPPLWLRHLHWLLVLSLIPLALSLLQARVADNFLVRLDETIKQAPLDTQRRIDQALGDLEQGKGSLETLFAALPDHRLRGAFLPRGTWAHWLFTLGAAVLFLAFLLGLTADRSATPAQIVQIGLFTATLGILFLFLVQTLAQWSQGIWLRGGGLVMILFYILKFIGYSYQAALDPDNGFVLSFLGYTLGVGLCEEICKVLPLLFKYREPNDQSWRGAYLWGLASGAGFGLAEGVIYASDFYNGISGPGIYIVRNISCVALHALWAGSAAITIHQKQYLLQAEMTWHDWLTRAIYVVAVPMVLHGLYDTLLKKDMNALALAVAIASFLYLAFQISQLRGSDDQAAHEEMLREYQRRRQALNA